MLRECRRYSPFIIVEFQARALIVQRLPRRPKDRAAHARFVSSPSVRQKATGSTGGGQNLQFFWARVGASRWY
jgi:hypothetical protein